MSNVTSGSPDASSWDSYWAGATQANLPLDGRVNSVELENYWRTFFSQRLKDTPQLIIELACGAGPVSELALKAASLERKPIQVHCTDYSSAAIRNRLSRNGPAAGFAADAAALPVATGAYDMAVSQFGLEYAGAAAFEEAARILAPKGILAAVVHFKGGGIEQECAVNLEVVTEVQALEFLPRARDVFDIGFSVLSGRAPRDEYIKADKAFAPITKAVKALIASSPPCAARRFLERLYMDLGYMYPRLQAYVQKDIEGWIQRGEFELKAYQTRMASMIKSAQSQDDISDLMHHLSALGLILSEPLILKLGEPAEPAAWVLFAEKSVS